MTDKIIDLEAYKAKLQRLREQAEREEEQTKRDMLNAVCDWFALKVEQWRDKDAPVSDGEPGAMRDYLTQLTASGRLFYIYHAIEILQTEGEGWQDDRSSIKAVLDSIMDGGR
jgi:hypothetical protein